jgi:hypothetical protein
MVCGFEERLQNVLQVLRKGQRGQQQEQWRKSHVACLDAAQVRSVTYKGYETLGL